GRRGQPRPRQGGPAPGDGRPVRGDEGGPGRLLPARVRVEGRGARVGEEGADPRGRLRRRAPRLADVDTSGGAPAGRRVRSLHRGSSPVTARVAEVFRLEYARVVASVLRIVRDIDVAEEVVQEAFAQALDHWPAHGTPDRPGAWLLTTAQRLVRAKRAIRERGLVYEVPEGDELAARLPAVLSVVYLIFNEGYAAHTGAALVRDDLCAEAIRLGGMLAELMPDEAEALGLLALMELQASRAAARADADGNLVLLADQDRARWDRARIARGLAWLARAGSIEHGGPYQLQ